MPQAIDSRCFCPPERAAGCASLYSYSPSFFNSSLALSRRIGRWSELRSSSSVTLFVKNCVPVSLELYHTPPRRFFADTFLPSSHISPPLCRQSPVSTIARLVFPAPFFPVRAVIVPSYSEKFKFSKIIFFFRLKDRLHTDRQTPLSTRCDTSKETPVSFVSRRPNIHRSPSETDCISSAVFSHWIVPSERYTKRSAIPLSHASRCSAMMSVLPSSFSFLIVSASCMAPLSSKFAVGSSQT